MRRRFVLRSIEQHGRTVAVIDDLATGEIRRVHKQGSRYLNWDRGDTKVENRGLREVAREALA